MDFARVSALEQHVLPDICPRKGWKSISFMSLPAFLSRSGLPRDFLSEHWTFSCPSRRCLVPWGTWNWGTWLRHGAEVLKCVGMGGARLHVEIKSVAQDRSLGAHPLAASLSPISPCSTGPFPGGISPEKEVIPPCCRNWTPRSERCSAPWKLCVRIGSVQGPWQLRERSHLLIEIFSAQKEWQSRWDGAWNTRVKQR